MMSLHNYIAPLDMKECICHFAKWQIHPFISMCTPYCSRVSLIFADITPELLFGTKFSIRKMSMDGEVYHRTPHDGVEVHVMDVDTVDDMLYYYDLVTHIMKRSPMNNTTQEIINIHSALGAEGMAVDWVGR